MDSVAPLNDAIQLVSSKDSRDLPLPMENMANLLVIASCIFREQLGIAEAMAQLWRNESIGNSTKGTRSVTTDGAISFSRLLHEQYQKIKDGKDMCLAWTLHFISPL